MRKITLILLVMILVTGCQTEEQKAAIAAEKEATKLALALEEAANACAELLQTTVGFSGPSNRMTILKSYGWTPMQAKLMEELMGVQNAAIEYRSARDCDTDTRVGQFFKNQCKCATKVIAPISSCEKNYLAVLGNTATKLRDDAMKSLLKCGR
jgi:hypothetical protein|tara:strand:- start:149 stop:610 length:462 start_codon:yes stop_codon:yes gene_type:complete